MDVEAAASVLVSRTLDDLGYNQEMIRFRQRCWEKRENGEIIIAGSKGEGLAKVLESDTDYLSQVRYILCTSRNPALYRNSKNLTVLKMDRECTYPGYTRLIRVQMGTMISNFLDEAMTQPINGDIFLSSDSWRSKGRLKHTGGFLDDFIVNPDQGPSSPFSYPSVGIDCDNVHAIVCDCPDILQPWINRVRKYSWPSPEIIEEISKMEAHVVPVGFKGSPTQFLEWRICFTKAELKLIQSLNDCQLKLIILLKMITKNSLKPVCKEMTSYVLKNVVLWMAELYSPEFFTENNLFITLKEALRCLRDCLTARYLPSYMIPERNLFVYISTSEAESTWTQLCGVIDVLLQEGPKLLLRCEKIRGAWNLLKSDPVEYRFNRNVYVKYEITFMLCLVCNSSGDLDSDAKNQVVDQLIKSGMNLFLDEVQELYLTGIWPGSFRDQSMIFFS